MSHCPVTYPLWATGKMPENSGNFRMKLDFSRHVIWLGVGSIHRGQQCLVNLNHIIINTISVCSTCLCLNGNLVYNIFLSKLQNIWHVCLSQVGNTDIIIISLRTRWYEHKFTYLTWWHLQILDTTGVTWLSSSAARNCQRILTVQWLRITICNATTRLPSCTSLCRVWTALNIHWENGVCLNINIQVLHGCYFIMASSVRSSDQLHCFPR